MDSISYKDIIKHFNQQDWDFSYLTYEDIWEVLNQPIKYDNLIPQLIANGITFSENTIFLVLVKRTKNFDYSFLTEFNNICEYKIPNLIYSQFWCNYKYAAVKAGLGQFAKNSLFYHPKFQFETHLCVIQIKNLITDLPLRNPSNFNILDICENCNDCYNACPVNAIHNQNGPIWIDTYKCDNFCHFGNHPRIPSIKWNWFPLDEDMNKILNNPKDIFNIKNYFELNKISKKSGCQHIKINGQLYNVVFPVCRECTSQSKCSQYNGNYPYNWNDISIIKDNEK